jgi:hypothetical protein
MQARDRLFVTASLVLAPLGVRRQRLPELSPRELAVRFTDTVER